MKPAGEVVMEAVDQVGNGILRDYALEIAVLLVGANSHVGGLREFCALAVLALALDCLMLCTFYTAILAIMIEVSLISTIIRSFGSISVSFILIKTLLSPYLLISYACYLHVLFSAGPKD